MEEAINFLHYGQHKISVFTPNAIAVSRVHSFWFKEPETLEWIQSFQPRERFFDIGANIGLYSLFAACAQGVEVIAFEPEGLNYALLNRNIFLNKLDRQIVAYPLALSDETRLGNRLYLSYFVEGASCHNVKEALDFKHEPFQPAFSQGCLSFTLDHLMESPGFPLPHHIKIDVDGVEHKILQGASKTLSNPQVKSVLVELNTNLPEHRAAVGWMEEHGFTYSRNQVEGYMITEGRFQGVANHIFFRKS